MKELNAAISQLKAGEYLICDVFDRPLRVVTYLTNGLGHIYQRAADGTARRVIF